MAGHSASKTRVNVLTSPAIHVFSAPEKGVDARDKRGHDGL
jgi:hypothetical protein